MIQSELSKIFGGNVLVIDNEYGLRVIKTEPFYEELLSVSKLPKKYDAQWIVNKIQSKNKQTEDMKARRAKIIAEMRKQLAEKGIKDFSTYETTFGFSVCNLFQDGLKYAREVIEKCGIQYKKIEYSSEHWVVRVYV
jgi:uncharacterized radical SAM superfamily Fe-S cluster-containing enzyme